MKFKMTTVILLAVLGVIPSPAVSVSTDVHHRNSGYSKKIQSGVGQGNNCYYNGSENPVNGNCNHWQATAINGNGEKIN